jgi:hypothetical protein
MTIGTLSPNEKDLYKIVSLVRALTEGRNNLTSAQATALLDVFAGDSGSGGVKGLVPAPAAGDAEKLLRASGGWASAAQVTALIGIPANIRVFAGSSSYPTVSNGGVKVLVMAKGAGGGGGSSTSLSFAGGSGGEGATSWKLAAASALSGQPVTIGAGGANVAANTDAAGGTGGTTSIGSVVSAPGGGGGGRGSTGGAGGAGGSGGTRDWGMPGIAGGPGQTADGSKMIGSTGGGNGGGVFGGSGIGNSGGGGGPGFQAAASGPGGSGILVCIEFGVI